MVEDGGRVGVGGTDALFIKEVRLSVSTFFFFLWFPRQIHSV